MKMIALQKYWQYLFWLGLILAVMGLSSGIVSGSWGVIPLSLLIVGIVLMGVWLGWQNQQNQWWGRRSTQAGTNALVATLSVLVILSLINFLAVRYPARVDLTETQLFTLAPQSKQLVKNLKQPVKVWIFDRNQNPQYQELLKNYQRQAEKFSFEFVDPQLQPGLAQKFGVQSFGEVYLEAGEQRFQVATQQEPLTEEKLTSAIQRLVSNTTAKVYFVQGHGEVPISGEQGGLSQAVKALGQKNYTIAPLNLVQTPIPQDASIVVVASPKRSLFPQEVKALSNYLHQGGSVLLLIDPNTNPGLDSLLKEWGVKLDNRLVIDPSGAAVGLGPLVPVVNTYGEHPITQDFGNGISFYREARPIDLTPVTGVQSTPLVQTNPQSWAESDLNSQNLQLDPNSDRPGPLTLGVALSRPAQTSSPTKTQKSSNLDDSRLVVFGNSQFATDGLFGQQLNGDIFLNSVSWLTQQDDQQLSIRPKELKNRRINFTPAQANLLGLTALGIVPLIGLAAAAILWWLRR